MQNAWICASDLLNCVSGIRFDDDAGSKFSPDPVSWFGGISPVNNSSNFSAESVIFARRSATAALDGHRDAICEISALTNASSTPSYILRAQKITSGSLLIFSGKNLARRFQKRLPVELPRGSQTPNFLFSVSRSTAHVGLAILTTLATELLRFRIRSSSAAQASNACRFSAAKLCRM